MVWFLVWFVVWFSVGLWVWGVWSGVEACCGVRCEALLVGALASPRIRVGVGVGGVRLWCSPSQMCRCSHAKRRARPCVRGAGWSGRKCNRRPRGLRIAALGVFAAGVGAEPLEGNGALRGRAGGCVKQCMHAECCACCQEGLNRSAARALGPVAGRQRVGFRGRAGRRAAADHCCV
eukprot:5498203-Prymnesium_polylepis.5